MQAGIHNTQFKFSEKKSVQDKLLIFYNGLRWKLRQDLLLFWCRHKLEQSMMGLETVFSDWFLKVKT